MGDNEVLVNVIAENESVRTYKIKVKKSLIVSVPNTAAGISVIVFVSAVSAIIIASAVIIILTKDKKTEKNS